MKKLPSALIMLIFSMVVMIVLTSGAGLSQDQLSKNDGLFDSREVRSENMKAFSKWTSLWRRYNLPRRDSAPGAPPSNVPDAVKCSRRNYVRCKQAEWEGFIKEAAALGPKDQLETVNLYLNKHPYIVDPVNWGLPDYWATPDEFFMKDGDCEDYAISKYITLKRLGVAASTLRLVVVQDENLRTPHAVLAVALDGVTYILDNQVNAVLPHNQILHYRPVYSINEEAWWLHQRARFGR